MSRRGTWIPSPARQVLELFRGLARDEDRALLIVTHDPGVRSIADRVVAIRDGCADLPGVLTHVGIDVPRPRRLAGNRPGAGGPRWPGRRSGAGPPSSGCPVALASLTGRARTSPPGPARRRDPEHRQPDDPPIILAEGHVAAYPGAEVVVGAELAGTITRVLVQEKSAVHKGDLLVEFRGDEIRASAEEAVARVAEADAELSLIEQEQARVESASRAASRAQAEAKDRLKARWTAAKARRAAAVAGYRRIEAEFARTRVRSPIDGVVDLPRP